jgi:hypothetical protein
MTPLVVILREIHCFSARTRNAFLSEAPRLPSLTSGVTKSQAEASQASADSRSVISLEVLRELLGEVT